jgi:hypothetical protein
VSLLEFIQEAAIDVEDVYRSRGWSWTRLQREAGLLDTMPTSARLVADKPLKLSADRISEERLLIGISRLLHIDDPDRLDFLRRLIMNGSALFASRSLVSRETRMLEGFLLTLAPDEREADVVLQALDDSEPIRNELQQVLDVLEDRAEHQTFRLSDALSDQPQFADVPLALHARYTRDEVFAALGRSTLDKPFSQREGPFWHLPTNTDYFFITLEKSEKDYSPSTRYRDYAIAPDLFHWESQSKTPEGSEVGQRYIHHARRGSHVMLLVRASNKDAWGRTPPFTFLGPATYVSHTGERPMAILWRLHRAMPLDVFKLARVAAG